MAPDFDIKIAGETFKVYCMLSSYHSVGPSETIYQMIWRTIKQFEIIRAMKLSKILIMFYIRKQPVIFWRPAGVH